MIHEAECELRVLVLDDDLSSASGAIKQALRDCVADTTAIPDLEMLESEWSTPVVLNGLAGCDVSVRFSANDPDVDAASMIAEQIAQGKYAGPWDIVLIDDNWKGDRDFGGQDVILPAAYRHLTGMSARLPLLALFTQHWVDTRLDRFYSVVRQEYGNWDRIVPCEKKNRIQLRHVFSRAVTERVDQQEILERDLRLQVLDAGDLSDSEPCDGVVGQSVAMRQVYHLVRKVCKTPTTVLIRGESGTGKELIARAIHDSSPRREGPFICVNCGALSETLLDSELFGHVKGAFTGAGSDKVGRFEAAHGGTLFLDEIGTISTQLQIKLLRVLQERAFERVGESRTRKTDVRVIAATNADLEQAMTDGTFRSDLYYRLKVFPIVLPSLRHRPEDIPALVDHFVSMYCRQLNKNVESVAARAMEAMRVYAWPGNVRELENCIEQAVVLCEGTSIEYAHLPMELRSVSVTPRSGMDPHLRIEIERRLDVMLRLVRKGQARITGTTVDAEMGNQTGAFRNYCKENGAAIAQVVRENPEKYRTIIKALGRFGSIRDAGLPNW